MYNEKPIKSDSDDDDAFWNTEPYALPCGTLFSRCRYKERRRREPCWCYHQHLSHLLHFVKPLGGQILADNRQKVRPEFRLGNDLHPACNVGRSCLRGLTCTLPNLSHACTSHGRDRWWHYQHDLPVTDHGLLPLGQVEADRNLRVWCGAWSADGTFARLSSLQPWWVQVPLLDCMRLLPFHVPLHQKNDADYRLRAWQCCQNSHKRGLK